MCWNPVEIYDLFGEKLPTCYQNIKYAYFWTQHMYSYKETRAKMFAAALFLVAKSGKQSKSSSLIKKPYISIMQWLKEMKWVCMHWHGKVSEAYCSVREKVAKQFLWYYLSNITKQIWKYIYMWIHREQTVKIHIKLMTMCPSGRCVEYVVK